MIRKSISKRSKSIVALAAMAALLMTSAVPVGAVGSFTDKENEKSVQTLAVQQNYRNVMYYGDWSIWAGQGNFYPKDIPADQLTHLNFAFLDFNDKGELQFTDTEAALRNNCKENTQYDKPNAGVLAAIQGLKLRNPNLKIGVSLGGWSKSGDFSTIAANPQTTQTFVDNVMKFVKYCNMDFVDVDWEYPVAKRDPDKVDNKNDEGTVNGSTADKANFIKLLKALRSGLDKQGVDLNRQYELSVALPAPIQKVQDGIDVKGLFDTVDFANIMTYDMRGAWDQSSGHQAALYTNPNDPFKGKGLSVDESVNYYMSQGAPSKKIVVGAAFYTRGWGKVSNDNIDPKNPGLFGKASICGKDADLITESPGADNEAPLVNGEGGRRGGVWSYGSLDKLKQAYSGLKEYWDDSAKAPYLYNESTGAFFTYDNIRSVQEKCKYVKEKNLGGMISWMASQDKATTGTKRDELTKTIKEALYGSIALPQYEVQSMPLDVTASVKLGTPDWDGSANLEISFTNNEKANDSGEVLSSLGTRAKTIKYPKLYIEAVGVTFVSGEYPCPAIQRQGDYYLLDFSKAYDTEMMAPGKSVAFKIKCKEKATDISVNTAIKSMILGQNLYTDTPETKQVIYGNINVNSKPVINASNKTIAFGSIFNPMDGVTASDKEDGDLTSKIKYTGSVNTNVAGDYTITYSVTDSKGETTTKAVIITVLPKQEVITIAELADRYNAVKGDSRYVDKYDLNKDNTIDIYDMIIVGKSL